MNIGWIIKTFGGIAAIDEATLRSDFNLRWKIGLGK